MIPEKVRQLCLSKQSVTSLINDDPTLTPEKALAKLLPEHTPMPVSAMMQKVKVTSDEREYVTLSEEDLEDARRCGKFGDERPSTLFLQVSPM